MVLQLKHLRKERSDLTKSCASLKKKVFDSNDRRINLGERVRETLPMLPVRRDTSLTTGDLQNNDN